MNVYLVVVIVAFFLMTPIRAAADVWVGDGVDAAIDLRVWGVGGVLRVRLIRDDHGHHLILLPRRMPQKAHEAPPEQVRQGMVAVGTVLRANAARHYLLRHIRLLRLRALVRTGAAMAGKTALLSGLFTGIAALLTCRREQVDIRIRPDFLQARTTVSARCILFTRLGNLLFAALPALIAWLGEKAEHRGAPHKKEA